MTKVTNDIDERLLEHLLDALDHAADNPPVTVDRILNEIGERSFSPMILAVSVLIVSPLSGIPGAPTLSGLVIMLIAMQALVGQTHLWFPGFVLRQEVKPNAIRTAVSWLRRPLVWFDRHSHSRWPMLTVVPMRWVAMTFCAAIPLTWPFLEILPFVTSFSAGAVALLAFGLLTRDGLYVLLGYSVIAVQVAMMLRVLAAAA